MPCLKKSTQKAAPIEMRDEYGVTHRLWPVSDIATIRRIQKRWPKRNWLLRTVTIATKRR